MGKYVVAPWGGVIRKDRKLTFQPDKGPKWGAYASDTADCPVIASTNEAYVRDYARRCNLIVKRAPNEET